MKKLFTLTLLSFTLFSVAQDVAKKDTSWKTSGFFGLNASQTALSNWQGGGQNNVAVNGILNEFFQTFFSERVESS